MRESIEGETDSARRTDTDRWWIIAAPFVFAIWPASDLWWRNRSAVSVGDAAVVILALVIATAISLWAATRVCTWKAKAVFLLSCFWIWLFSYDATRTILLTQLPLRDVARHRYLIPIWFCILVIGVSLVCGVRKSFRTLTRYLAVGAFVIFGLQLIANVTSTSRRPIKTNRNIPTITTAVRLLPQQTAKPDIYYIILDQYSGAAELNQILGFDNSSFVQYLEGKGFYVPRRSYSNYSWTLLSMAATLNLNYLPTETTEGGTERVVDVNLEHLIAANAVETSLQRAGYSYVDMSLSSDEYSVSRLLSGQSDSIIGIESFAIALAKMTLLSRPVVENVIEGNIRRAQILRKLEDLKKRNNATGPVFVYAHLLVPHHPYIFDRFGNRPPWKDRVMQMRSERELYLDQVRFANTRIREVLEALLTRDGPPPIVIVQGDHGADPLVSSAEANRRLRMGILNAYYVPDAIRARLYDSITPVNSFRLILNHLGADLPLLNDQRFFSTPSDFSALIPFDLPPER